MYGWASILRSLHSEQIWKTGLNEPFKLPIRAIRKGRGVEAFWGGEEAGWLGVGESGEGVGGGRSGVEEYKEGVE